MSQRRRPPGDKKKKKRKKLDPNAPKRFLVPFLFFAQSRRPAVRASHPTWGIPKVGQLLGEEWRAMDDQVRPPRGNLLPLPSPLAGHPAMLCYTASALVAYPLVRP